MTILHITKNIAIYLGALVVFCEVTLGSMILFKKYRHFTLLGSLGLFLSFLGFSIFALSENINVNCGCFGPYSQNINSLQHFLLLVFLIFINIFLFLKLDNSGE